MFLICYSIDVIVIPLILVAIPLIFIAISLIFIVAPTQHAGCESPGLEAKNEQAGSHHFR